MAKFIVVGDSYAVHDKDHSHWAKLWADKHGHAIDLLGLEGSNLVNISTFVENLNLSSYDGLIYQFTSLLRSETTSIEGVTPSLCILDQLGKISIDSSNDFFNHCLPKDYKGYEFVAGSLAPRVLDSFYICDAEVTPFNMVPFWYDAKTNQYVYNYKENYDLFMTARANGLYNNTSIRWIVRANMMAYKNTILSLNNMGLKHVTVFPTCGGFKPTLEYLKHQLPNSLYWDQTDIVSLHPNETESRNHVDIETAKKLADNFNFF